MENNMKLLVLFCVYQSVVSRYSATSAILSPQKTYQSFFLITMAVAQIIKALPHRMSDGAKVAFADDSVLFGRRNGIEAKVVDKAVKVALYLVLRWLQAAYFLGSPLLSLTASAGGFCIVSRNSFSGKIFLLLSLRGLLVRVSLSSHFGGTIEEGIFFCMLCYAILCYAMCTKVHILTVLGEKCCIYRDNCCIFTFVQFFFFGGFKTVSGFLSDPFSEFTAGFISLSFPEFICGFSPGTVS